MRSIYKYELKGEGPNFLKGHFKRFLDIKKQGSAIVIWAEIDEEQYALQEVEIWGIGTGWNLSETDENFLNTNEWKYLGTEIDWMGYVWHFYMKKQKPDNDYNFFESLMRG